MNAVGPRTRAHRFARLAALVVVAVTGLTCRDSSVTGPGLPSRANLAIAPRFAVVDGGPSIVLHQARAELFRLPGGSLATSAVGTFAADGSDLEMSLSVILTEPEETFVLRIAATNANGDTVFRSVDSSTVLRRGLLAGEPVPVVLTYSGADVLAVSLATSPEDTTMDTGTSATFRAVAKMADSTVIAAPVGWRSSDSTKLRVTDAGVATALSEFTGLWLFARTATGLVDSSRVSAVRPVGSVVISPAGTQLIIGRTLQMTASVRASDNSELPSRVVTWSSSSTSVATVSQTGLVTGIAAGTATITARSGGVNGTATVTVIVSPVVTVEVAPADTTVFVGDTLTMRRTLRDDQGTVLTNRVVVWTSLDPAVAQVNQTTGLVTAVAEGTARLVATSEGKFAQGVVRVMRRATTLTASEVTGVYGGSVTLTATLTRGGLPLPGRTIVFKLVPNPVSPNIVGTAVTDANGVATLLNASLGTLAAGVYGAPLSGLVRGVVVEFAGDGVYLPAEGSAQLTILRAPIALVLSNLSHIFDGTPKAATVTTTPLVSGVTITYTQNGQTVVAPTNAGSYTVTASLDNPNYVATPVTGTLVIAAGTQLITFSALPSRTYGEAPFTVTATSSAGLPVTYSSAGNCSVDPSSGLVTIIAAGSCTITASQPGNGNYSAAASVSQSFAIAKATATLTLGSLTHVYDGSPKSVTVTTAPAGLAVVTVTYTPSGGVASTTPPTAAGSYAVTALLENPDYTGSASGTMVITAGTQTIAFAPLGGRTFGDAPFAVSATASSGLAVSFAASGTCSVSGNVVTLTAAGSCTITASQVGTANYSAAASVSQSFTIVKATATLTLGSLTHVYDGTPKSATAVTTNPSGLAVITITYNGSTTPPTAAGSYAVSATLSNANYEASPVSGTLTIGQAVTTLAVSSASGPFGGTAPLSATLSRGGTPVLNGSVTFSLNGTAAGSATTTASGVASIPNGNLSGIAVGSYPTGVAASYAGDANHLPSSGSATLSVGQGTATITLGALSQVYDGTPRSATATTSPAGLAVTITYDGTSAAPTNAGSYAVVATTSDPNYTSATATGTLVISQATATITLDGLAQTYDGGQRVVSATATPAISGTVDITYNGSVDAPVNAGSYAIVATVTDPNYAGTVTGTLVVAKGTPTITWFNPADITYGTALDGTQLNARADFRRAGVPLTDVPVAPLAGTHSYTPPAGTVLAAGAGQVLSVVFTPEDPNLNTASATVMINVLAGSQTITFDSLPDRLDGEPDFAVSATASSGLAVTFAASGGACSMASPGVVRLLAVGTCTITATQAGNSNYAAAADVPRSFAVRSGITGTLVTPASATMTSLNDSLQLSAQSYAGSSPRPGSHSWVSRNPSIASVSASGLVVAHANGVTYVVVADSGGTRDSSRIIVQQQVSTVTVTPGTRTLYLGTTFQFSGSAVDNRGNPVSAPLVWSSTAPAVASPDLNGLVSATGLGSASIRATAGGVIGTSAVTVITAIQRIAVTPDTLTVSSLGVQTQYTAVAYDTLNAPMSGITFEWSSTNPSVASVDSVAPTSARVISAANGVTSIRAVAQGVTGSASLKVQQVLASVEVTPATASIGLNGAIALVARGKDANNRYISGGSFTWSSSNTAIATVSTAGVVTGKALGTVNISATSGGITSANPAVINVANSVPAVISFGRDTLTVGRATSLSIPVYLSTPSASPVTVNLSARDTVAYFSTTSVTFPANVTSVNATLSGRNAGTTQVYAVDSASIYGPDTAVVKVQATVKLAVTSISINATDSYSTQVLLSDPSPAGGTYVTFVYSVAGIASASPDPAFVPAGQLAADVIIRGNAVGITTITPTAQGVNGTGTTFNVGAANLTFNVATRILGLGQYRVNDYVYTPRTQRTSLPVTLTTADTLIARLPTALTIVEGSNLANFTTTTVSKGRTTTIASSAGWTPDTVTTIVSTPKVGICCGTTMTTTNPPRAVTVYAEDSVNVAHPRINSLVVTLSSSDTNVIRMLDTIVTIAAGASSANLSSSVMPVGGGTAWVRTSAGGHTSDSVQFTVTAPKLNFGFTTTRLGAGQQNRSVYLQVPNNVTTPLTVSIANPDTSVAYTPPSVTLATGSSIVYFTIRGHTAAPPLKIIATAPGYSPDTATITVTTPRITTCCDATINNFSLPRTFTVFPADSVNTNHETIAPLTVTLASSDTNVIRIDSASITIAAGASSNNKARVRPVGEGTAKLYVTAPNGYVDSLTVYTVLRPKLAFNFTSSNMGLRQETTSSGAYISTPDNRTDSLHVSIVHKRPEFVRHIVWNVADSDTALTIPASSNVRYFGYAGIGYGRDTIIASAPGYASDTAFVTVTSPKFTTSNLPTTATTTSPLLNVTVFAADSLGVSHLASDTVVIRAVSSDTTVMKPESLYYHLPRGVSSKLTKVRYIGPGTATITYSDSAGLYLPITTTAVTVTGPSLLMSHPTTMLGMRQNTGPSGRYVYTANNVTTPLVVRLTSSDTRVATVPDSVIIPAGSSIAYYRVTAHDTLGTVQIQATATGYFAVTSTAQATVPQFSVSTSPSVYTTTSPQVITVYAADANGATHFVNDTVRVMLSSTAPSVAYPDSTFVSILPNASFTNKARMRYGVVGTAALIASDTTSALYGYDPDTTTVNVTTPPLSFSFNSSALGEGQYFEPYVKVPNNVTGPLKVALRHVGVAKVTVPDTVTITAGTLEYFRIVAGTPGVDTIEATAPGHLPDRIYVTVGTGRIDPISNWPSSMTVGQVRALTLYARDQDQTQRSVTAATTFSLSPNANIGFYSDLAATIPITQVTVAANTSSAPLFYVKALSSGTGSATITNAGYTAYNSPTITIP